MKRYKLINGCLHLPPRGGITAQGHAISNFDAMVERDAAFATLNGYYPMGAVQETQPVPKEGFEIEVHWELSDGAWQCRFEQIPLEDQPLV